MARANLLLVLSVRAERLPVPLVLPVPLGWVRDTLRGGQLLWGALRRAGLQAPGARAVARLLPAANALPDPAVLMALAVRALDSLAAAGPVTLVEVRQGPTRVAVRLF